MEIILNDKYRVTTDKHNYVLEKKRFPDPNNKFTVDATKFKWIDVGYYGKLEHLVNGLTEHEIKSSEVDRVADLEILVTDLEKTIFDNLRTILKEAGK